MASSKDKTKASSLVSGRSKTIARKRQPPVKQKPQASKKDNYRVVKRKRSEDESKSKEDESDEDDTSEGEDDKEDDKDGEDGSSDDEEDEEESSDMETVFQTRYGDHQVSALRVNMETLAPSLWIDNNVVDCWGAILNYEESAKKDPSPKKNAKKNPDPVPRRHFFPTGCITDAMVKGTMGLDEQWDSFSAETSAHLKNVDASSFLAEIELAFFPIQVSCHFYVVVFNIKKNASMTILDNSPSSYVGKYKVACELLKEFFARLLLKYLHPRHDSVLKAKPRILQLKWKTNENFVDCGVFAMIHMESYFGESVKTWDVGLCSESDMQVSLLRRMRFKIATKILLHELNLHSQKMYDLALKFHSEIPEQTRISIIVNAIKNRNDRDPERVVPTNVIEIPEK